ncbi:hypothetical protein ACQ4PT_019793 [Festuca glaucescens]
MESKCEYHAVMSCSKAHALHQAMREVWYLPKEEDLRKTIMRCQSIEEAEPVAVLEGMKIAATLNQPITIECDCEDVVNALNSSSRGRSQASLLYDESVQFAQSIQDLHATGLENPMIGQRRGAPAGR